MPREVFGRGYDFLPRSELLTYEEIARLTRTFVGLGVRSIRLTGGEPLLRRDLENLVAMLAGIEAIEDLSMTTNGALLADRAARLSEAGLDRVNVSLDSLEARTFALMNDTEVPVRTILDGIDAAAAAGLTPIKVNCVVRRGFNDGQIVELARHLKGSGHILRFIEYMDVGGPSWERSEVVTAADIVAAIDDVFPLEPIGRESPAAPATRYRYRDGTGEIGVIPSVTQPFCGDCTRARLSADGKLFTCLFASTGLDLKTPSRSGASDEGLRELVMSAWGDRADRYSELRDGPVRLTDPVPMSYLGG
jgi:cyclic pyranopterin phosphate synthase